MPNVNTTVVIPVAPEHEEVVERAVESVKMQTTPVAAIVQFDKQRRGPGWARNQALREVRTQYVTFLDADDWLEMLYVETCLSAMQNGKYVYTDWFEGKEVKVAPDKPWCMGTWHVVTALLPTAWVRAVGGFDEKLPGAEDTDFWLKITTQQGCGIHVHEPLMHYTKSEASRAHLFAVSEQNDLVMSEISRRYRGKMGCCGGGSAKEQPVGEKQEGDVLVQAMWGGNQTKFGPVTGRVYPRNGNGKQAWVDPRDAQARPDLWRRVDMLDETEYDLVAPAPVGVEQIADQIMADFRRRQPTRPAPRAQGDPADYNPDINKVLELARQARANDGVKSPAAQRAERTAPLVEKAKRGRPRKSK